MVECQWFTMQTHRDCWADLWSETHSVLMRVIMNDQFSIRSSYMFTCCSCYFWIAGMCQSCEFVKSNLLHHVKLRVTLLALFPDLAFFYTFYSFLCLSVFPVCNCMTNLKGQVAVARCSCFVNSWQGCYQDTQFYVRGYRHRQRGQREIGGLILLAFDYRSAWLQIKLIIHNVDF